MFINKKLKKGLAMSMCFSELKHYTVQWPYCARIRCGGIFKCTIPEHNMMRAHTAGQGTIDSV